MNKITKTRQKVTPAKPKSLGQLINDATPRAEMQDAALLMGLREICLSLPEVRETIKWGHPTFEAGKKAFSVLDHYHGRTCIAFRASKQLQMQLLRDQRFFAAPYAAAHGWVCLRADGGLNWSEVGDLIAGSYRIVALKRMLSALDGRR